MMLKRVKVCILIAQLIGLLFYNYRALTTVNHTGLDVRFWAFASLSFGMVILLLSLLRPSWTGGRDRLTMAVIFMALLTGANILTFDHLNIYVEYEDWLWRGMPEKPFPTNL